MKINNTFRHFCLLLVLIFVFTFTFSSYKKTEYEVEAVPLVAILLSDTALKIIGGTLIAGGLTFANWDSIKSASAMWYYSAITTSEVLKTSINNWISSFDSSMTSVDIPDDIWNSMRNYTINNYSVGDNVYSNDYQTINLNGIDYPIGITHEYFFENYFYYNGNELIVNEDNSATYNGSTILTSNASKPLFFLVYDSTNTRFSLNTFYYDCYYMEIDSFDCPTTLTFDDSVIVANDISNDITFDIKVDDSRSISVPDVPEKLVGATSDNVVSGDYSNIGDSTLDSNVLTDIKSFLVDDLIGGLSAMFNTLTTELQRSINEVKSSNETNTATLENSLTEIESNISEPDLTSTYENYNFWDLFLLLIDVIIACLLLILRAVTFVASLYSVPISTSLIDPTIISGIDFAKNIDLPIFNLSLWSIVVSLFSFLAGLLIIKYIRRSKLNG